MNFLIISHVKHIEVQQKYFAYAPYVREMNLWLNHVHKAEIIAPLSKQKKSKIDIQYEHPIVKLSSVPEIEFTSFTKAIASFFKIPYILVSIFIACKKADHIHLRCPGNIGFLGCIVQIFFPKKIKTAKYAGNWDPGSKQPISYGVQKWILRNTFLTKNMKVLVYGDWKDQTGNIMPFFTASFSKNEISPVLKKQYSRQLKFLFVGGLVIGKRPWLSVKIVEALIKKGVNASLDIYGDGILMNELQNYVIEKQLGKYILFHGNQNRETLKNAYMKSHFVLLPSKSEGWPKAIAEGMFFGSIPIATGVSCVPQMLDYGNRGILIKPEIDKAIKEIELYQKTKDLQQIAANAASWSQKYTLDAFEIEIEKLIVR